MTRSSRPPFRSSSTRIHHSETGFTASEAFEDLLDLDAEALSVVAAYVPRFRFLLDDISGVSEESIRSRAMGALGRLVQGGAQAARRDG
jgi:hypothetical protein